MIRKPKKGRDAVFSKEQEDELGKYILQKQTSSARELEVLLTTYNFSAHRMFNIDYSVVQKH